MNAKGLHYPIDIPIGNRKKVLLSNLTHLCEIIDIAEKHKCGTLARTDLDNPNTFYEFW